MARQKKPPGQNDTGGQRSGMDRLLGYYRDMLLIRRFEERAGQLYGMGLIGGFCHLYIGQEAIAVGVQAVREPGDQIITGYRDHGHMLACGMDPNEVMAELTGRSGGSSKGKGGSMHMSSAETHLYKRGASFNIPGIEVDGMDVVAVEEATRKAAEHARSGKGPFILEMKTYRYRGHSMSDPAKYRTREEVHEVRKTRDPIDHLRERLEKEKLADDAKLKAIDAEAKSIVAAAVEFARTSPEPQPGELYTDVYTEAPAA